MLSRPLVSRTGVRALSVRAVSSSVPFRRWKSSAQPAPLPSNLKPMSDIPGPPIYPLIGQIPTYVKGGPDNFYENFAKVREEYGDFQRIVVPPNIDGLQLFDPRDIEKVYRVEGRTPRNVTLQALQKAADDTNFENGLILVQGEKWKKLRKAIQKTIFPPKQADNYIPRVAKISEEFSNLLNKPEVARDPQKFLRHLSLDMMASILYKAELKSLSEKDEATQKFVNDVCYFLDTMGYLEFRSVPIWKFLETPTYKKFRDSFLSIYDYSSTKVGLVMDAVAEAKTPEEAQEAGDCLLGHLLARGASGEHDISEKAIKENVNTFLMAGVDTTSISLLWLFYNLSTNPETQVKLREEIMRVCPSGTLTEETYHEMPYLRACIKESMRATPTALGSGRYIDQDLELRGYFIPKGTWVSTSGSFEATHNDKYFENPTKFDPERFMPGAKEARKAQGGDRALADSPYLMMPFGRGPRMCVGSRLALVEMAAATTRIIRDWDVGYIGTTAGPDTHPKPKVTLFINADPSPLFSFTPTASNTNHSQNGTSN